MSTSSRLFTRLLAASAMTAGFAGAALAQSAGGYTLTILHVNDIHSRLPQISAFGSTCSPKEAEEAKCFGGMARIATKANEIRAEVAAKKGNLLFLHAGDQYQGSLFFTVHRGQADIDTVNMLGIDVGTFGNHEFDIGPDGAARYAKGVKFPIVSSNIDVTREPLLQKTFVPYVVVERGGQRIGIIGATTEDTAITSSPGPTLAFYNEIQPIRRYVEELKMQGVNKIVALTHAGYARDREIAEQVDGLDVIVGGHSHTLLATDNKDAAGPSPVVIERKSGGKTLIVQAGEYSKYLGRIDVTFDAKGDPVSWTGNPILLDAKVAEDKAVLAKIKELEAPIAALRGKQVGVAKINIDGDRKTCRQQECTMGNLVTDALFAATKAQGTQIVITNGGGLRASIAQGDITMGHVLTVLPFQNTVATLKLKGSDILAALENGVSKVEEEQGRFPQVAGMKFTWDRRKPAGSRILSAQVADGKGGYAPLDPNMVYKIATNDFMRRGGDGYAIFKTAGIDAYDFGPNLEEAVAAYITSMNGVEPKLEGRITEVKQ